MTTTRALLLTGIMAVLAIPAAATACPSDPHAAKANYIQLAAGPVVCMTDEGGGRYKPCDSGYKAANPNWQSGDTCMTDEGGGRYKPCDSGYKQQMKEQQQKK